MVMPVENKIPRAEDFWKSRKAPLVTGEDIMIQFAKFHVKAALKAASETKLEAIYDNTNVDEARYPNDIDLILTAYPLENIK